MFAVFGMRFSTKFGNLEIESFPIQIFVHFEKLSNYENF